MKFCDVIYRPAITLPLEKQNYAMQFYYLPWAHLYGLLNDNEIIASLRIEDNPYITTMEMVNQD